MKTKPTVESIDVPLVRQLLKNCPTAVQDYVRALEHLKEIQFNTTMVATAKIRELAKQVALSKWVDFDPNDRTTGPKVYEKYLVCRKDGKIHWETWNGTGWAYNHNEIRQWAEIYSPVKDDQK